MESLGCYNIWEEELSIFYFYLKYEGYQVD